MMQKTRCLADKVPLLSVLVPAYNRERYLETCVKSALLQPFHDLEVVIADNSSTDATYEIAMRLAQEDARVKVIRHERNMGPIPNWKSCLEEARGAYIHWLWSDDFINHNFYSSWKAFLDGRAGHETVFCGGADIVCDLKPHPIFSYTYHQDTFPLSGFVSQIAGHYSLPVSPAAYILPSSSVRKHFYDNIPISDSLDCVKNAIGSDLLMIVGSIADHGGVAHLNSARCVNFRAHEGSISVKDAKKLSHHYAFALLWFLQLRGSKLSVYQKVRIARRIARLSSGTVRKSLLSMLLRVPTTLFSPS